MGNATNLQASELDTFLVQQGESIEELQTWAGGAMPLRVRAYLSEALPPIEFVTTLRAVVFQNATVLTITAADGWMSILPGGRREAGETLEETLRREVLEETGWTLQAVRLLGFLHFHHLAGKPEGYRYPYPDFLQIVYTGQADVYRSEAQEEGVYTTCFQPLEQLESLSLSAAERMFLNAGLQGV